MRRNVLIMGAGGVAHVVAHKCAQHNDKLGNICIASRTVQKCDQIAESILRKGNLKDKNNSLTTQQVDAMDISALSKLINETGSTIVLNVASPFTNLSVLQACLKTGAAYLDTSVHEDPLKISEPPPWYANYEWNFLESCQKNELTAILSTGFDPGVVNAYCAYAAEYQFDSIDTIDIMDVNAGDHGKYFATNFDPEINFREFTEDVWAWIDKKWVSSKTHSQKREFDFPVVGKQTIYLSGHDEIHSLSKNVDANSIRFWMGFSDHYINCFSVLKNTGLLSEQPVTTAEGQEVVPLKVVKACLPDPMSLAPNYSGKTCIGNLIKGSKDGQEKQIFIYNTCDHAKCYQEVEAQAISYTAGVPAVAAALLVADGIWDVKKMVNVEELPSKPFLDLLGEIGLPTEIKQL